MSKPEILVLGRLRPPAIAALEAHFTLVQPDPGVAPGEAVAAAGDRFRAIACNGARIDEAVFSKLPDLAIVASFGVGYDNVDAAEAGRRGVIVTNTPDVLTEEVADTTLGLLLMTVRELSAAERHLRAGKWLEGPYPLTKGTLRDRKAGIAGLGRIGRAIARRLEAFGVPVVYHSRRPVEGVAYPHYPDLVAMARDVDTLISVMPGGAATEKKIGREVLEALGPRGVLINIGRGTVVDEEALAEALASRTIHAAGLDVFAREPHVPEALLAADNAVLLPHVGSGSEHTRDAMGQLLVDNLVAWSEGRPPVTPVAETPFTAWRA